MGAHEDVGAGARRCRDSQGPCPPVYPPPHLQSWKFGFPSTRVATRRPWRHPQPRAQTLAEHVCATATRPTDAFRTPGPGHFLIPALTQRADAAVLYVQPDSLSSQLPRPPARADTVPRIPHARGTSTVPSLWYVMAQYPVVHMLIRTRASRRHLAPVCCTISKPPFNFHVRILTAPFHQAS